MNSEHLEDLLTRTRLALLAGDFTALEELARETEVALDHEHFPDPESLDHIRNLAAGNAALIGAAARGVSAAKNRLTRPERFSTYDSQGHRGDMTPRDTGRSHRL